MDKYLLEKFTSLLGSEEIARTFIQGSINSLKLKAIKSAAEIANYERMAFYKTGEPKTRRKKLAMLIEEHRKAVSDLSVFVGDEQKANSLIIKNFN